MKGEEKVFHKKSKNSTPLEGLFLREIDMNSPGKCTSVVEQKFDFRSFRPGTELISGKPQGSVSVISGLEEAGNATTGEQKAYCYFATAVLVYILHYYNFLF